MKCITRTITSTSCNGQEYDPATGEYSDFNCVLDGALSLDEANEIVRKRYPFVMVTNVEVLQGTYSMPIETFVQYASLVK